MRVKTQTYDICSKPVFQKSSEKVFHVYDTKQTLESEDYESVPNRPSTSNNASHKPKKPRNLLETTEQKGLRDCFLCISHKSNPWKAGTMKVYKNTPSTPNNASKNKKTQNLVGTT